MKPSTFIVLELENKEDSEEDSDYSDMSPLEDTRKNKLDSEEDN